MEDVGLSAHFGRKRVSSPSDYPKERLFEPTQAFERENRLSKEGISSLSECPKRERGTHE
jgi:hypothetical protein